MREYKSAPVTDNDDEGKSVTQEVGLCELPGTFVFAT